MIEALLRSIVGEMADATVAELTATLMAKLEDEDEPIGRSYPLHDGPSFLPQAAQRPSSIPRRRPTPHGEQRE